MTILMVLEREFPPDDRVEKEAQSLSEAGHEIHIACYTRKNQQEYEKLEYYTVHRKSISVFTYKSGAFQLLLPLYERFWRIFIDRLFRQNQYDAIHIHDLPLARTGYRFKRKYGVKLICDQHEYYSDWIVKTAHYNTIPGKIIKVFSNWKAYERYNLSRADAVITVEQPLKNIYINNVGLPEKSITVIPNTPMKSVFQDQEINAEILKKYEKRFVLIYIGGLDKLRGLDLAMKAVSDLKDKIPGILLLLIGPKSKYHDIIEDASRFGISENFEWIPFQPVEILPSYLAASDICFHTPPANRDEVHRTVATKVYQYLAMGKPIIVSKVELMQKLVESNNAGFAVDDSDPTEFSARVMELAENPRLRQEIGSNAKKLSERYFWEHTVQPLLDLYDSI